MSAITGKTIRKLRKHLKPAEFNEVMANLRSPKPEAVAEKPPVVKAEVQEKKEEPKKKSRWRKKDGPSV